MRIAASHHRLAVLPVVALAAAIALHCATDGPTAPPRPPSYDTAFTITWPFFSHDGAKVYFLGQLFGIDGSGIYEVDTAGGKARLLMRDSLVKRDPKLSPDGTRICYRAGTIFRVDCCAQLYITNTDGSGTFNLTPWSGQLNDQRWSPDGSSILAAGPVEDSGQVHTQIFRINSDGSGWKLLTGGLAGHGLPRWDADGANIFFGMRHPSNELGGIIAVMNADGSGQRLIDSTLHEASTPRPSPARKELGLLFRMEATSEVGGYLLSYDSLQLPAGEGSFHKVVNDFPYASEWSPDGNFIGQLREGPSWSLTNDLYVVRRDNWSMTRLTQYYRISWWDWSPDSRFIVFLSFAQAEERAGVFIVDVSSGRIRKLTIQR
jgi:Tol biopolymer transport system component